MQISVLSSAIPQCMDSENLLSTTIVIPALIVAYKINWFHVDYTLLTTEILMFLPEADCIWSVNWYNDSNHQGPLF